MKWIPFALVMILMVGTAAAQSLPMIIDGKVKNEGFLAGYRVTLTNTRTNIQTSVITGRDGTFMFMPANMQWGAQNGDDFVLECEGKQIQVNDLGYNPVEVLIDLTNQACPKPDPCPSCPEDNTPYASCDICCPSCPDCPDDVTPYTNCDSCCLTPEPCPVDENKSVEMILVALAGLGVGVGGVYLKLGKTAQHLHKGIIGYHSIYTSHKNVLIKHPRGENMPVYKLVNDKWTYISKENR